MGSGAAYSPTTTAVSTFDALVLMKSHCFPPFRVETKLHSVEAQFTELDSSLQKLAQKFELQAEKMSQDPLQMWVPGET